jgi:glutamyl-tRNA synthetase
MQPDTSILDTSITIKTRIAPTPSGFLHLGNLYSFVLTWLTARCAPNIGGSVHLRLDDIDASRTRGEYVEDIFATLDWLGLDWDSGAQSVGDFYKNHSQQLFLGEYQKVVMDLLQNQKAYFCACSRKELNARPCPCRDINLDKTAANVRLLAPQGAQVNMRNYVENSYVNMKEAALAESVENFIIQDKNKRPTYMLVAVIEDVRHDINLIVRGQDLYETTAAQLFLAGQTKGLKTKESKTTALASFENTRFLHHSLLLNEDGLKLSKSAGAAAVQDLRTRYSKTEFFRYFSHNLFSHNLFAVKQETTNKKNPPVLLIDNLADLAAYFSDNYWALVGFSSTRSRLDHTF